MNIQAVIFDLDGLLVDSEAVHYQTNRALFAKYGKTYDLALKRKNMGVRIVEWLSDLKKEWSLKPSIEELANEREVILRTLFSKMLKLMPGALSILAYLKNKHIPMGLATSAKPWYVDLIMERFPLKKFFTVVIDADQVSRGKPHPEMYLKTAEALGVRPQECLVLEDAPNGVAAAKAAGMICFAVPGKYTKKTSVAHADRIFTSLIAVQRHLLRYL